MPSKHAKRSPSSGSALAICPHYRGKSGTSKAAESGTQLHEFVELFVRASIARPSVYKANSGNFAVSSKLKQMWSDFDTFEQGYASVVCSHCHHLLTQSKPTKVVAEIQLDVAGITWGTCDLALIYEEAKTIVARDWKFGQMDVDTPECNFQAMGYVIGLFTEYPETQFVEFGFLKPRVDDEVSTHTFHRDNLDSLVDAWSRVRVNADAAEDNPDLGLQQINGYCQWCTQAPTCPALNKAVKSPNMKSLLMAKSLKVPKSLDTETQRRDAFVLAKSLMSYAQGVLDELVRLADEEGEETPNTTLVRVSGRKTIRKDDRVAAWEASLHGIIDDDELSADVIELLQTSLGEEYDKLIQACDMKVGSLPKSANLQVTDFGLISTGEPSSYLRMKKAN